MAAIVLDTKNLTEKETKILTEYTNKHNINIQKATEDIQKGFKFKSSELESERMKVLELFVDMTLADEEIDDKEMDIVFKIANQLHIERNVVEQMIEQKKSK